MYLESRNAVSMNFGVSCFLTLFTTFIADPDMIPILDRIWDLMLADGYNFVLKVLVYIILD